MKSNKRNINAIDLDKTIIPFDSFRFLIVKYIRDNNFATIVTIFVLARKFRLLSASTFKRLAFNCIMRSFNSNNYIFAILEKVESNLNTEVLRLIEENSNPETINVLISASPEVYVKKIADKLNWECIGTTIKGKKIIHCYGEKKKDLIIKQYPKTDYHYNFAISDSKSDLSLLSMFEHYKIVN